MADTAIKPEIKLDPAAPSPGNTAMNDVEAFEDDTDLHFPSAESQAWLAKVPKYLWDAWSEIYHTAGDEQGIEIGTIRVYDGEDQDPTKQKVQIRLNAGVPQHQELPKNYKLEIKTDGYSNMAVFSERDLPGHTSRSNMPFGPRRSHLKPTGIQPKSERYGQTKPGTYRTAIPKQTALAPQIRHMADVDPVADESYYAHFGKVYREAVRPKRTVKIMDDLGHGAMSSHRNLTNFSSFGISSRPGANKKGKKIPKEKAVRISQEALLDRIYHCFRRYRYWSLKALRNELKQPEQYIKQTLEDIATLVRSGDFAMNYVLKPEYAVTAQVGQEEIKEETALVKSEDDEGASGVGSDGDDVDTEFEDVKMEGSQPPAG